MNDSVDALESTNEATLPVGAELIAEAVTESGRSHYIRLTPQPGESLPSALVRMGPWLETVRFPPGTSFAWGNIEFSSSTTLSQIVVGWRSYLIRADPFLTSGDVEDVALVKTEQSTVEFPKDHQGELIEKKEDKWSVRIHLRPAPSQRLKQVMRERSPMRLALLVDGHVVVAPRVSVGTDQDDLTIDMGAALNQAESLREAQRLSELLSRPSAPIAR